MPEFESQRFFFIFLAYLFVVPENLEFLMLYAKAFFYLAHAQFICKRIYFIDAKQEGKWADNITEPGKGKNFNQGMSS